MIFIESVITAWMAIWWSRRWFADVEDVVGTSGVFTSGSAGGASIAILGIVNENKQKIIEEENTEIEKRYN